MNIGFFDSGLGGLTVLREVVKALPAYNYVYYADAKHLPYGDRSEEEILSLTKAALRELFDRDCALIVVACNTVSAETLRTLQDSFLQEHYPDRKVLGVIIPTMEVLASLSPRRAVLLATERTIQSQKYARELDKLTSSISLISRATPELVPCIEADDTSAAVAIATRILSGDGVGEGDVVVLGCTHYTVLKHDLRTAFPKTQFLSQDEIIPDKLMWYLDQHPEIESKLAREGGRTIHLTEHKDNYHRLTAEFLGGSYLAGDGG